MDLHKQLTRHLKQLNRAIRRLVGKSREFEQLRKLLREEQVELAIYVVPILPGQDPAEARELQFELTEDDRSFLKQAGIRF